MKKAVLGYEWDETFDAVPYEEPGGDVEMGTTGGSGTSRAPALGVPSASLNKAKSSDHQTSDGAAPADIASDANATTRNGRDSQGAAGLFKRGSSRDRSSNGSNHSGTDPLRPASGTMT